MKGIKVVQVAWNWINESGGAAQSIANFQNALGSFVVSFTRDNASPYKGSEQVKQLHIPYHESTVNRYSYTRSPLKQLAEQTLIDADLIVCHGFYRYHFDWAARIAKQHNIPYWVIPHGSLDPYVFTYRSISKKVWFRLLGNESFSNAAAFIFATESERDKSYIRVPLEISRVIHWPVKYINTQNRVEAKSRVRKEHNIPPNAKVLLFIGRIHPMKRPVETIRCVATCGSDKVYLMVMGPDSDVLSSAECNKLCINNGYKNIRFISPVYNQEKYDYYMAADAFISLSHRENFGYTVAEALLSGIPVILSPGNDLSKDIRHLNCGWLLEDDSPENATRVVNEFVETPGEQLVEMGGRGQKWARAELSPERFKSQIQALALDTVEKAKLTH